MIRVFIVTNDSNMITCVLPVKGVADPTELDKPDHNKHVGYIENWDIDLITRVLLTVTTNEEGELIDFTTSALRPSEQHILCNEVWVLSADQTLKEFNALRQQALRCSDWTQLADAPPILGSRKWRQQLRDVTQTATDPRQWLEQVRQLIATPPTGIEIT